MAGLIGAGVIAIYPALLEYQGLLLTEPLAATLLSGRPGRCSSCRASRVSRRPRPGVPWAWLGTGALFGLLALVRPEYLLLALGLPLVWLAREALFVRSREAPRSGGAWCRSALSLLGDLPRPRPVDDPQRGRARSLRADLDRRRQGALHRHQPRGRRRRGRSCAKTCSPNGRPCARGSKPKARSTTPTAWSSSACSSGSRRESYPDLETDAALGRLGRQNLEDGVTEEPLRFAGMMADKSYDTWTDAARGVMLDQPWRTLQLAVVILALAGVAILVLRRRRFEALVAGLVLLYMTAIAALLIASPRRELVVLPAARGARRGVRRRDAGRAIALRADSLGRMTAWIRSLPDRYGRTTLILLAAILALGFGLRAYRVVEPLATPGDDAHAYYDLSKSLYEEGSYGSPRVPRRQRLVAGRAAALRRLLLRDRRRARRDGADRRAAARDGGDRRRLPARQADRLPPGGADRRLRRRRLPALHPLDRRPLQRAAGDLHPAGRGARLPLGGRAGAACGAWLAARASSSG